MAKAAPAMINKADFPIFGIADKVWRKYPHLRGDCSGYLRQVARDAGVELPALLANNLVAYFAKAPGWINLGRDPARAAKLSAEGYFVVGGETEAGHGHVVVVVPGWSTTGHPMGYWGRLNGIGQTDASLSTAWVASGMWNNPITMRTHPHLAGAPSPLSQVLYFAYPVKALSKGHVK